MSWAKVSDPPGEFGGVGTRIPKGLRASLFCHVVFLKAQRLGLGVDHLDLAWTKAGSIRGDTGSGPATVLTTVAASSLITTVCCEKRQAWDLGPEAPM